MIEQILDKSQFITSCIEDSPALSASVHHQSSQLSIADAKSDISIFQLGFEIAILLKSILDRINGLIHTNQQIKDNNLMSFQTVIMP